MRKMEKQYLLFDVGRMRYAVPMEYVGYIIPASGEYPSCVPPRMPSYIKHIISIEKRQVAIIELENFAEDDVVYKGVRPLVLILNCQNKIIGLQADNISILPEHLKSELIEDDIHNTVVLNCDGNDFILLDVPELFEKISLQK